MSNSNAGLSRRNFLKLSFLLGGGTALAGATTAYADEATGSAQATDTPQYPAKPVTFMVMSDTHYFDPSLWSDCADYTTAVNSDRKMFSESRGILKRAIDLVRQNRPDVVLIPGDLTKDGEYACHQGVHALFEQVRDELRAEGVDTRFYFINGNHDLNNHNGQDFSTGSAVDAERTDPAKYKELWAEYGYTDTEVYDASGTADGSLTYAAHPFPGLTVIAVDTCKYNLRAADGTLAQTTEGDVDPKVLDWVCERASEARAAGDLVVAIEHHGVVPHFSQEPTLMWQYLVGPQGSKRYEEVARRYSDAGIDVVFTGHMHANDIASATYGDHTIYDIETDSLVTYPSYVRTGTITYVRDEATGQMRADLAVHAQPLGHVDFEGCGNDGQSTDDITTYGGDERHLLSHDAVITMAGGMFVGPLLDGVAEKGTKATIAGLLGMGADEMVPTVWKLLVGLVGPDELVVPGYARVGMAYDQAADKVTITVTVDNKAQAPAGRARLYLDDADVAAIASAADARGLDISSIIGMINGKQAVLSVTGARFAAFLDTVFSTLDSKVLGEGRGNTMAVVNKLIGTAIDARVDDSHTVLNLANFAYKDHLMGDETTEPWFDAAVASVKGGLLSKVIGDALNATLRSTEAETLGATLKLDLKALFTVEKDIKVLGLVSVCDTVFGMMDSVAKVFGLLGYKPSGKPEDVPAVDLGALVGGMLPQSLTDLASGALESLTHDVSVLADHDFTVNAGLVAVAGNGGSGNGNGGSGNGGETGGNGNAGQSGTGNGGSGNGNGNAGETGGNGNAGQSGTGNGATSGNGATGGSADRTHSGSTLPKTFDPLTTTAVVAAAAATGVAATGLGRRIRDRFSDDED